MARHAGAGDLRMVDYPRRSKLDGGVAGIARVCRRHVRFGWALQLAQNWAGRNRLRAIMAREAAADDLRMVHHCHWFEQIGVVAGIAGVGGGNMGRRFADRGIVVVAGDAFASKAWLRVVRLGVGYPSCSTDMAILAVLSPGIEDRVRYGPCHSIWFARVMTG